MGPTPQGIVGETGLRAGLRRRLGQLAAALALELVLLSGPAAAGAAGAPQPSSPLPVVPTLRQWIASGGTLALRPGDRIVVTKKLQSADAETFRDDVRAISGLELPVTSRAARSGDIVLSVGSVGLPASGYKLRIGRMVRIEGEDEQGLFEGTQSVEQMLKASAGAETLPLGSGSDWPSLGTRGIMLDLSRHFQPLAYLKEQIRMAAWYKLDEVHLHLSDTQGYRLPSQAYPQLPAAEHYSTSDIAAIVQYARRYHVTLLPEIDVPAHATPMTAVDPSLGWTCPSIQDSTYWGVDIPGDNLNITEPAATQFVETLLTEVMQMFPNSPIIDIGGDEYASYRQQQDCPQLVDYAAAHGYATTEDVFTSWQNTIAGFLQAHGRQAEIWNWWDVIGDATVTPSRSIVVEPWFANPPSYYGGYKVVSAPQDGTSDYFLYLAPGDPPGGPEVPEDTELYDSWQPATGNPDLLGYESPLWAGPPPQPFAYDEWFSWTPWAVMADRTWGGPKLASVFDLEDVLDHVGAPPGIADDVPTGQQVLHGTPYGSPSAGAEHGPALAFDGDPATSYRSGGDDAYAGIDLGAGKAARVSSIRYVPVQDPDPDSDAVGGLAESLDMVGGEFQGCTQGPTSGCIDLAPVRWRSTYDWHQLTVTDTGHYRWLRLVSAAGQPLDVSEIQFLTGPAGAPGVPGVEVEPPTSLTAGGSASITVTLVNHGRSPARFTPELTLTNTTDESTLSARPLGRAAVWVAAGRSATLRWQVQVPASATPGDYEVAVRAPFRTGRGRSVRVAAVEAVAGTSLG